MNFLMLFLKAITVLPGSIQSIEALLGAKTGTEKKAAALSIVQSTINVADAVTQKTIVDAPAFTSGLGAVIDGVVACLNASIWHKALPALPATPAVPGAPSAAATPAAS